MPEKLESPPELIVLAGVEPFGQARRRGRAGVRNPLDAVDPCSCRVGIAAGAFFVLPPEGVRAGAAYDIAVLRPWRGAVIYRLFGPAVDLEAEAVVGPGVLLVVELDRALAGDRGLEVGILTGRDSAALGRVRPPRNSGPGRPA